MMRFMIAILALASMLAACADEGRSVQTLARAQITFADSRLNDGDAIVIRIAEGEAAAREVGRLLIENIGDAALEITALELEGGGPFTLGAGPAGGLPVEVAPGQVAEAWSLTFLPAEMEGEGRDDLGAIIIRSNSVSEDGRAQPRIRLPIEIERPEPALQLLPGRIDFGVVRFGDDAVVNAAIVNPGGAQLEVQSLTFTGHGGLSLELDGVVYAPAGGQVALDPPVRVAAGTSLSYQVRYQADDGEAAFGRIVFYSNAPGLEEGAELPIQANSGGPCLEVDPDHVRFGGKKVGQQAEIPVTLRSCGDEALLIYGLSVASENSDGFSLSLPDQGGRLSHDEEDTPIELAPGTQTTVLVHYFPEALAEIDEENRPLALEEGRLVIEANTYAGRREVEIDGYGVEKECPVAEIIIPQGNEVIPQTQLDLVGSQSWSSESPIVAYRWSVEQPIGVVDQFSPSPGVADPSFEVNAAGVYRFELEVEDAEGVVSCFPAVQEVVVTPDEALHVELLWSTPGDPDEHDDDGADLDLHFKHEKAVGLSYRDGPGGEWIYYDGDRDGEPDGWFDDPYDAYFFQKTPDWRTGIADGRGNPRLDRDDTNGIGPENLNLAQPEEGAYYDIGVHYYSDGQPGGGPSFGASYARIRVYIHGDLELEIEGVELWEHDMWEAARLYWPYVGPESLVETMMCQGTRDFCEDDGDCAQGTCGRKIIPGYRPPPMYPQ